MKSKYNRSYKYDIIIIQLNYWIKEINPDFFKQGEPPMVIRNKFEINDAVMSKYPPCVKALAATPSKGNYARFLAYSWWRGACRQSFDKKIIIEKG